MREATATPTATAWSTATERQHLETYFESPTETTTVTPAATPSPTVTPSPTRIASLTPTPTSTGTATPARTASPTVTPTATPVAFLVTTGGVGREPHGLAVDSVHGLVYVANHRVPLLSVIDGRTGRTVRNLSLGSASGANGVEEDQAVDLVFIANKFTGDVIRVSGTGGRRTGFAAGGVPARWPRGGPRHRDRLCGQLRQSHHLAAGRRVGCLAWRRAERRRASLDRTGPRRWAGFMRPIIWTTRWASMTWRPVTCSRRCRPPAALTGSRWMPTAAGFIRRPRWTERDDHRYGGRQRSQTYAAQLRTYRRGQPGQRAPLRRLCRRAADAYLQRRDDPVAGLGARGRGARKASPSICDRPGLRQQRRRRHGEHLPGQRP